MLSKWLIFKKGKNYLMLFWLFSFLINLAFWFSYFLKSEISVWFFIISCLLPFIYWTLKMARELKIKYKTRSDRYFWKVAILFFAFLGFAISVSLFIAWVINYELLHWNILTKEKIKYFDDNSKWFYTSSKFITFILSSSFAIGICLYVWIFYFIISFIAAKKFHIKGLFSFRNSNKLFTFFMIIFIELLPIQIPLILLIFLTQLGIFDVSLVAPIIAMPLFLVLSFCFFKARPKIEDWIFEFIRLTQV